MNEMEGTVRTLSQSLAKNRGNRDNSKEGREKKETGEHFKCSINLDLNVE